jgi:hypothetical protein
MFQAVPQRSWQHVLTTGSQNPELIVELTVHRFPTASQSHLQKLPESMFSCPETTQ